jgi:putative NADPH-quinone reductase
VTEIKNVLIIQGHPDAGNQHLCDALAAAYASGARAAGHTVELIEIAKLDFPLLRSAEDFRSGQPPETIRQSQQALKRCQHVVLLYPVWNGGMPALLKGFLEQVFRPSFVFPDLPPGERVGLSTMFRQRKALAGRTARIVVTMQMPAFFFRWYFRPRSEKSTLGVSGVGPIRDTLIGGVDSTSLKKRRTWLKQVHEHGRQAR